MRCGHGNIAPPYQVSAKNKCRNPHLLDVLEGQLDRDITDLTILLEPGQDAGVGRIHVDRVDRVDPAVLADFNDAKAGPITGVPPRP